MISLSSLLPWRFIRTMWRKSWANREHRLYAKSEKCEFERHTIQFLGLILSSDGIAMDSQKVSAIIDWPVSTDKKAVQRFVGFANVYRKFIKDFSGIISPITQLNGLRTTFSCTTQAQVVFEKLKNLFTSAPILKHPDPALPYVLEVDASKKCGRSYTLTATRSEISTPSSRIFLQKAQFSWKELWCRRPRIIGH